MNGLAAKGKYRPELEKQAALGNGVPLYESNIKSLKLLGRGKVRDMYAVEGGRLLIVTSDRLSPSMWSFPIRYPIRDEC